MATKPKTAKETVADVFAGRSVGELLVEAFTNLVDDAKSGEIAKYNCRDVLIPSAKEEFSPQDAIFVRNLLGASQAVFAGFMGVSTNAVQTWEQGQCQPNGTARRVYRFIKDDPAYWRQKFHAMLIAKEDSPSGSQVVTYRSKKKSKSPDAPAKFSTARKRARTTKMAAAKKAP